MGRGRIPREASGRTGRTQNGEKGPSLTQLTSGLLAKVPIWCRGILPLHVTAHLRAPVYTRALYARHRECLLPALG